MKTLVSLLLVFLALPAAADFCDLDLRYEEGQIRWRAITGATDYHVLETYGSVRPPIYYSTKKTFVDVDRRASGPINVRYTVSVEVEPGVRLAADSSDACFGEIDIILQPDAAFRKFTRRAVIPVVGSTAGAFGGKFKTALELHGSSNQKGRLVFHPAGRAAADDDPSIPYSFTSSRVMTFDDVVAAMGQQGLGSLDIVPDDDSTERIPEASVRLYNDTTLGTFGTFSEPVLPFDYLRPQDLVIRIPDNRFRVNIGIRALEEAKLQILIYRADGRLDGFKNLTFAPGWMEMKSANDFVSKTLEPGGQLIINASGAAVPFYTITENATNDPTLVLAPAVAGSTRDLSKFVD